MTAEQKTMDLVREAKKLAEWVRTNNPDTAWMADGLFEVEDIIKEMETKTSENEKLCATAKTADNNAHGFTASFAAEYADALSKYLEK